ncbi:MAG: hypothetical protein S0880_05855 [Actinomycetota bacterium]|nr:hypothetical protein [Actinomycetota bacterium]
MSRQVVVPPWAWLNVLAHGTLHDLRGVDDRLGARRDPQRWGQARAYLAGEVLAAVGCDDEALAALQRNVLVPIELDLAMLPRETAPEPRDVVGRVLAELDAFRRSRAGS